MKSSNKSNSNSEKFQYTMENTPGLYASSQTFIDTTNECNSLGQPLHPPNSMNCYPPVPSTINNDHHVGTPSRNVTNAVDNQEYIWFNSDITLSYINNRFMEEGSNDKVKLDHGESAFKAMEEPFYGLLGQNHPICPRLLPLLSCDYLKNLEDNTSKSHQEWCSSSPLGNDLSNNHSSSDNLEGSEAPWSLSAIVGGRNMFTQTSLNVSDLSITEKPSKVIRSVEVNNRDTSKHPSLEVQNRKTYPHAEDFDSLEGRSTKQLAISFDETVRDEMFDNVLLSGHKPADGGLVFLGTMATKSINNSQNNQGRASARRKKKGKKQMKKEVVDLRSLLIHCAQAVSANNHTLASDILNTIRQHSSASGDGSQRLAFCLADCLEVRLAGTGGQIRHKLTSTQYNARDMLKLVHLYISGSPFLNAAYYLANKTILDVSMGKPSLHIIDFGIYYGFQWPSLFAQLGEREGGPPKIRITGVEVPQTGLQPDRINMNARQRLTEYAEMFNIPFEYRGISSNWDTICPEDFNIEKDDVLIVNCIYRMKNLGDETISVNSGRDKVLNTIRMMKPNVFVVGVQNGSYSTPFFLTRFKEVMYHYSALFDVLDKTTPPEKNEERVIMERRYYQKVLTNVIACEGSERIERPESYKKWKARNLRLGFEHLPLNPDIVQEIQDTVKKFYHKEYVVCEDDKWLLLGWKGRTIYALSTWKPNESNGDD